MLMPEREKKIFEGKRLFWTTFHFEKPVTTSPKRYDSDLSHPQLRDQGEKG